MQELLRHSTLRSTLVVYTRGLCRDSGPQAYSQTQRKSYKTYQIVGWVVGWEFLGKTALNASRFMNFRSSAGRRFPLQFNLIVINGGTDEIF
jgi:hypothetical protein